MARKKKAYSLYHLPIGTLVWFYDGVRGKVVASSGCERETRYGKSIILTHWTCGDEWGDYACGYLDIAITKIRKLRKKGKK